jgi:hypothetical protein
MADADKPARTRDLWDRLELVSKVVGGVSIPIFGLLLSYMLHAQTESSQKAQLYASITATREKADSDVRSQMFSRLLDRYLGTSAGSQGTLAEARDRIMFLDLLRANFEEYFNARPLFSRLYEQIRIRETQAPPEERPAWSALRQELVEIAKDTTSRQVARLVRSGHLTEDIVVPLSRADSPEQPVSRRIALYPTRGLTGLGDIFTLSASDWATAEPEREPVAKRYSITIRVKEMLESSAKVSVLLYRDAFDGRQFNPAQSLPNLRPIEFEVSYFSTPYMDNTRLFDGSRFSVIYDGCIDTSAADQMCRFPLAPSTQPKGQFKVVVFDEAFLSQRDRPYVDQILERIGKSPTR